MKVPVTYSCSVAGAPVDATVLADAPTLREARPLVHAHARERVGASARAPVECAHISHPHHVPPSTWIPRKMAPNCNPRFDLRDVTTINNYTCYYTGEGVVEGKRVRRPFASWTGRLASCDGPDEYMQTSDGVMDAVKEMAYAQAGGDEAQLNKDDFVCFVQSLPHH